MNISFAWSLLFTNHLVQTRLDSIRGKCIILIYFRVFEAKAGYSFVFYRLGYWSTDNERFRASSTQPFLAHTLIRRGE